MPIVITTFDRRDGADRADFAQAALDLTRAQRASGGERCRSSRYYWEDTNTVVFISDWTELPTGMAPPDVLKAQYRLGDLARMTSQKRLTEAGAGAESYRAAGRA